jgi:hypothetical protein
MIGSAALLAEAERQRLDRAQDLADFSRAQPNPAQGALVVIGVTVNGVANTVQSLKVIGLPTGGTFTLTGTNQTPAVFTTAPLAWNITAAALQAALALATAYGPGAGNVTCAGGPFPGQVITVTWGGVFLNKLVLPLTGDPTNLTGPDPFGAYKEIRVRQVAQGEPSYPTTAQSFYRVNVQRASGPEVVGGAASYLPTSRYIYAANVGGFIPPLSTRVKCTLQPKDRYAFRF